MRVIHENPETRGGFIATNTAISTTLAPALANSWSVSIIGNGCTRLSGMFRQPSLKTAPRHEIRVPVTQPGAPPLRPWDLTPLRQNGFLTGRLTPPRPFRPLSRRSGRIPASPYPPLRYHQSGSTATPPAIASQRTAI